MMNESRPASTAIHRALWVSVLCLIVLGHQEIAAQQNLLRWRTAPPSERVIVRQSDSLAICIGEAQIALWPLGLDRVGGVLQQPGSSVFDGRLDLVALVQKDRFLITARQSQKHFVIWDLESRTIIDSIRFESAVRRVQFNADRSIMAVVCLDGTCFVLRLPEHPEQQSVELHRQNFGQEIFWIAINSAGTQFAVSTSLRIHVLDIGTLAPVSTMLMFSWARMEFTSSGTELIALMKSGNLLRLSIATGDTLAERELFVSSDWLSADFVEVASQGDRILVSDTKELYLINATSLAEVSRPGAFAVTGKRYTSSWPEFSADGSEMWFRDLSQHVRVVDAFTGSLTHEYRNFPVSVRELAVLFAAHAAVVVATEGSVHLVDMQTGDELSSQRVFEVERVFVGNDPRHIVGKSGSHVVTWDVETGTVISDIDAGRWAETSAELAKNDLYYSRSQIGYKYSHHLMDSRTGGIRWTQYTDIDQGGATCFLTGDGSTVILRSYDLTEDHSHGYRYRSFDVASGDLLWDVHCRFESLTWFAGMSNDSRFLAIDSLEGSFVDHGFIVIRDTRTGAVDARIRVDDPWDLTGFRPQSTQIVAFTDGSFKLWDFATGVQTASIPAGTFKPSAHPVWNTTGTRCAIQFENGEVQVWEPDRAQLLWTFQPTLPVRDVVFSPNGELLFGLDHGGNVLLWNLKDGTVNTVCEVPIGSEKWSTLLLTDDARSIVVSYGSVLSVFDNPGHQLPDTSDVPDGVRNAVISIVPNPVSTQAAITVQFSDTTHQEIRIVDISGAVHYQQQGDGSRLPQAIRVPMDLGSGVYGVQAISSTAVTTQILSISR